MNSHLQFPDLFHAHYYFSMKLVIMPMRIVLYNYAQPDEMRLPGGGVTVYMRSLLAALRAQGHDVHVLSAGDRYDFFDRTPRLKSYDHGKRLYIVNSPVVAPAFFGFYRQDIYLKSDLLDPIPAVLRQELGEVDIFHFHNIEGLTRRFFDFLRHEFPSSRILFTAHNYNIVCPQVNLWYRNQDVCVSFEDGLACTRCQDGEDRRDRKILVNALKSPIKASNDASSFKRFVYKHLDGLASELTNRIPFRRREDSLDQPIPLPAPSLAAKAPEFRRYREANANLCASVFDRVIAVSARTREVLIQRGLPPERIDILYIGTQHEDVYRESFKKLPSAGRVHLGYIGYARHDKGFFFLLDCLEAIPDLVSHEITVTLAVRTVSPEVLGRIDALRAKYKVVRHFDGYTHAELGAILADVNLGVVCPLWEDNFPQVAMELVAHGIPIITSDRGGAQEIVNPNDMVVDVDDTKGFVELVSSISEGRMNIDSYWTRTININSIASHIDKLFSNYYV